jgi:NADH-quinone oxidoreductase subunit M
LLPAPLIELSTATLFQMNSVINPVH